MRLDQNNVSMGLLVIHLVFGLKAVKLTVSWINQIMLQMSTLVMADSKTRQYCIFQKYLPIAQTLTLHHLTLVNFSNWLLKKCKLSLMQSLELSGVSNDTHRDTRAVRKVSSHFEYLRNRLRGLDVTWQPVRGDLTVHP